MKLFKAFPLFLLLCLLHTGCKKKCGCENDPQAKITDTEVIIREDSGEPIIKYELRIHTICNKGIIPESIRDSLKKAGISGIKIKVTAEIYPYCEDGRRLTGPFMKIEKIESFSQE